MLIAGCLALALGCFAFSCAEESTNGGAGIYQTPCTACDADKGGLALGLWAVPYFDRITLTLDTSPGFTRTFDVVAGAFNNEVFTNVPAGTNLTLTLEGKPAVGQPDETTVTAREIKTNLTIAAGQTTTVTGLVLDQLFDLVPVKGVFVADDYNVADIAYITATFSGTRVEAARTYYMGLPSGNPAECVSQDADADNKILLPVGSPRTVVLKTYSAADVLIHQGTTSGFTVEESGTGTVTVNFTNQSGEGKLDISGGSCTPDCTGLVCGSDGCGGSCGGCKPGQTCDAGACI